MADETSGPAGGSNQAPNPTAGDANIRDDIAKILQGVKLPEKREFRAAADARKTPETPAPAAEPQPAPAPQQQAPAESAAQLDIASVHTLKDDLQHVVRDSKISVVRAVSLEQDRRHHDAEAPERVPPAQAHRGKAARMLFSVLILLILGIGALWAVYAIMQQRSGGTPAPALNSILFAENTVALPISESSPNDLKQTIAAARSNSNATLGSITRIVPVVTVAAEDGTTTQRPASLQEFLKALGTHAPDELTRALSDDFFFGIHTVDKNAPIIVVPVTSYTHAFAGMLAWEELMNADLSPAFTPLSTLTRDENGLPTKRTFTDLVMRNYDVRALNDDAGSIELYYSFPTQNMLIIAESPYSFAEVLSRLQASRRL